MFYGETFNDQAVDVPVGQTLEIRLQENRTTGFRWRLTADGGPACRMLDESLDAPPGPPGRGGQHSWRFQAVRTGECTIALSYGRAWETAAADKTFTLHVRVEGDGRGAAPRP